MTLELIEGVLAFLLTLTAAVYARQGEYGHAAYNQALAVTVIVWQLPS